MPLSHYRILDLTDDRGQFTGFLLAQLGADVICVEPPGGHRSRDTAPFIDDEPGEDRSLFHWSYNRGKRSVVVDDAQLQRLAAGADAVITSDAYPVDLAALRAANPALVTASITPFGSDGPKADWLSTDLTNFAAGGVMSVTGDQDRPPLRVSHPQSWLIASTDAVDGVLIALRERKTSGLGQHVDVSAQQAMITATQFCMMNTLVDSPEAKRVAGGLEIGPFKLRFVFECADGHVNVTYLFGNVIGPYTNRLFQWMRDEGECPDDLADRDWIDYAMDVIEGRVGLDVQARSIEVIEAFMATRTKAELLRESIARGALIAPITTTRELVELDHLAERGYWQTIDMPGQDAPATTPGSFVGMSASPATVLGPPPSIGQHTDEVLSEPARTLDLPASTKTRTDRPLAGLKVLDLFWALAGPGATKTLADFGATVIRVESETRPELLRAASPYRGEDGESEGSLQFHSSNAGKMHLQLNLAVPQSREVLMDLVKWADIVTESFTPRATRKMGLTYEDLSKVNPSLIMVSSCLMGHDGPLCDYPGFGTAGASFAGFYPITGWPDRLPSGPYTAYTDYSSPRFTVAAILAALEHRDRTGEGQYIDFSQMESAMLLMAPLFLDETVNGRTAGRHGNADRSMAPHVVVQTAPAEDDNWIAIACETDQQWQTLAGLLGRNDLAGLTGDERLARSDELEDLVARWTADQQAGALQEQLQSAGVPAHQVQNSTECIADPQLQHRNHFVEVPHPVYGTSFVEAPTFTLSRSDYGPQWAGPTMGQHTFDILTDFLGYDGDKIADLAVAGCLE
jgi:crotonobetainyl-CoA:carnitine CoA-transferase CaiB-like acyl-CoA transferase